MHHLQNAFQYLREKLYVNTNLTVKSRFKKTSGMEVGTHNELSFQKQTSQLLKIRILKYPRKSTADPKNHITTYLSFIFVHV